MKDTSLAAPGAGLPPLELGLMRIVVPLITRIRSRESFHKLFEIELEKILRLTHSAKHPGTPVLIKRIRGIEDSSRNWSVFMTLDHLHQVNSFFGPLIRSLAAEKTVGQEVRIADVKPALGIDKTIIPIFEESARRFLTKIEKVKTLRSQATHDHPWFGPMNARQLHALAAVHMQIHRKQIEKITAG